MDRKNSQKAYLSKIEDSVNSGAGVMDGVPARRKAMERSRCQATRAERNPVSINIVDLASSRKQDGDETPNPQASGSGRKSGAYNMVLPQDGFEDPEFVVRDEFGRIQNDIRYRSLLYRLKGVIISRNMAVKVVGGEKRLERLMLQGKIHASKKAGASNTMWRFDASEVARYVKPQRNFLT